MKKVFSELALLARTPQFAMVGLLGVYGAVGYLMHYSALTDKSGGVSYFIGIGAAILSGSYVILFLFLRAKDKKTQSSIAKKNQ